jgi:holin-like protein
MVAGFATFFALAAAGEAATRVLDLPLGGAVPGLLVLLAWLAARGETPTWMERGSAALLAEMGLLFVPAGAGVLQHLPVLQPHLAGLAAALAGGTLAGLVVAAVTFATVQRITSSRPVADLAGGDAT